MRYLDLLTPWSYTETSWEEWTIKYFQSMCIQQLSFYEYLTTDLNCLIPRRNVWTEFGHEISDPLTVLLLNIYLYLIKHYDGLRADKEKLVFV